MAAGTDAPNRHRERDLDRGPCPYRSDDANIAELIMGLDDVTSAFSREFDEMRNKTGWESFVGIFAPARADAMRQERMRMASIDDKLQDLISKSDTIVKLLKGSWRVLNDQKVKTEGNLAQTLVDREQVVAQLEAVKAEIMAWTPS